MDGMFKIYLEKSTPLFHGLAGPTALQLCFPPSLKLLTTLLCTSLFLEFLTHPPAVLYQLQQPDGVKTDVHLDHPSELMGYSPIAVVLLTQHHSFLTGMAFQTSKDWLACTM